jgi:hypothetical protein
MTLLNFLPLGLSDLIYLPQGLAGSNSIPQLLADVAPMAGVGPQNPYAVLTLIAAPAILTNASSVLALGTSNRFARAVDRQRQLSQMLDTGAAKMDAETLEVRRRQLTITERRALLLIAALTRFYTSLGAFAASALVSLIGAVTVPIGYRAIEIVMTSLALLAGVAGVGGLVFGCTLLVRETRLTVQALKEESGLSLRRSAQAGLASESVAIAPLPRSESTPVSRNDDALQ